jgi:hypothetical protein
MSPPSPSKSPLYSPSSFILLYYYCHIALNNNMQILFSYRSNLYSMFLHCIKNVYFFTRYFSKLESNMINIFNVFDVSVKFILTCNISLPLYINLLIEMFLLYVLFTNILSLQINDFTYTCCTSS